MEAVKTFATSKNVWIIDTAFYMPQLGRYRRVWLYLPEDYHRSKRRYPTLYMHDGQNLFEGWSSFSGEWRIDETLDELHGKCIVVAIDNGGDRRMSEYSIHDTEHGPGEGRAYIDFIVHTLKPYIDKTYRILEGRHHTYIAGSSMGGLISFYAALYYPQHFAGAGVFSPSFWLMPGIGTEVREAAARNAEYPQRFYFYAGREEGDNLVAEVRGMAGLLRRYEHYAVEVKVDPQGRHTEADWQKQFSHFYRWMMKREA